MPYSDPHGKEEAVRWMTGLVLGGPSLAVLDVGCGCGNYGRLLRHLNLCITGLDIWEPYVERFGLADLYDVIEIGDVREFEWGKFKPWDVVIFGDVLEHMQQLDAIQSATAALKHSRFVLVSVPLGVYEQGDCEGNPYEAHVSTWRHADVVSAWPEAKRIDSFDAERPDDTVVGVYVLSGANP